MVGYNNRLTGMLPSLVLMMEPQPFSKTASEILQMDKGQNNHVECFRLFV
jgi:hypothetical protein